MLKKYWNKWKKLAIKIGDFQFNLLFSALYYLLVVPIGFIASFFTDFLNTKNFPKWERTEDRFSTIEKLRQQY